MFVPDRGNRHGAAIKLAAKFANPLYVLVHLACTCLEECLMSGQDPSEHRCICVEHSRNLNQAETECAQLYDPGSAHDLIGAVRSQPAAVRTGLSNPRSS